MFTIAALLSASSPRSTAGSIKQRLRPQEVEIADSIAVKVAPGTQFGPEFQVPIV